MRIGYLTLGCKVNAYETQGIKQNLENAGYESVEFSEFADIYIINTCAVTNIADRKSRQMLHKARKQNPNSIIVAMGCYVQEVGEKLIEDKTCDIIIGNTKKCDIVNILKEFIDNRKENSSLVVNEVENINYKRDYEEISNLGMRETTRAYVKIQDGCNQFCSYCIIPYVRGRIRSRNKENIFEEVENLAKLGYKEIVLTGIHLSSYGLDKNQSTNIELAGNEEDRTNTKITIESNKSTSPSLAGNEEDKAGTNAKITIENNHYLPDLIDYLSSIEGIERIRLGSLEPRIISEEFVKRISSNSKVCPHFHLSLQSGCDETLKRMNRRYTTKEYNKACNLLRKYYDNPAITTDIIVGFPGETKEEFELTCAFAKEIDFYMVHIFKYSVRKGTKAAAFDNQIEEKEKSIRSDKLSEVTKLTQEKYLSSFVGFETKILFEEMIELDNKKYFVGHNTRYVKVAISCNPLDNFTNQIKKVRVKGFLKDDLLFGEFCD